MVALPGLVYNRPSSCALTSLADLLYYNQNLARTYTRKIPKLYFVVGRMRVERGHSCCLCDTGLRCAVVLISKSS